MERSFASHPSRCRPSGDRRVAAESTRTGEEASALLSAGLESLLGKFDRCGDLLPALTIEGSQESDHILLLRQGEFKRNDRIVQVGILVTCTRHTFVFRQGCTA